MATALPYGLRDIKLQAYADAAGTTLATGVGAIVDLPNAQTLSFSETEDFTELRGDDRVVTSHGMGALVDFSFESGGLPLEALPIMVGGTTVATGVTPNVTTTFQKKGSDVRPWFRITGRVISDSGGDVHAVIYRCKLNDKFEGEFKDGEFFISSGGGQGFPMLDDVADNLYDFIQHETSVALTTTPSTVKYRATLPPGTTAGNFTLNLGSATAAIAFGASADDVYGALVTTAEVGAGQITVTKVSNFVYDITKSVAITAALTGVGTALTPTGTITVAVV